ncbi:Up-regulated during septation-domain-containing protein [Boeremia exigua]|uniref:Up-regulated during septation-domain-containing protein n=1 Tax=Boeremia exigua TaxID=749465 RepID=UPI001E8E7B02|nr:Up-regulated during septation-domain-containing protein [Boeremia exigua]KAH6618872.1 Up-regulated during septation-domain-containing protein [Boeremia exigua]
MTHIASCIRPDAVKTSVYITQETSYRMSVHLNVSSAPLLKSPSTTDIPQAASRYQLWPAAKSPVGTSSEKLAALSVGRSATSLSDTAIPTETAPFWQRAGSMSRRRKVSVPELSGTMTTVQEMPVDSPTIPGRPPLRRPSYEAFGHERSNSAPGTAWRTGPFGDAMTSCITGPSPVLTQGTTPTFTQASPSMSNRPLSPILSPGLKPNLKVTTINPTLPPEVPPKSPSIERKTSPAPLKLSSKSSKSQLTTPASATSGGVSPLSTYDVRRSPKTGALLHTPSSAQLHTFRTASPRSSPRTEKQDPIATAGSHNRNMSESSIMDRGRPTQRTKRSHSRTCSESTGPTVPAADNWSLPQGMRVPEASRRMNSVDQQSLHKQAYEQAGNFEVLNKSDVASLSRELRALDERCDYLRKTYKSLRAGRQKLHSRMISYLKRGETNIFSRESLLKQEEALAELDNSIDEFIAKLEQSENRRLRLRQKLLEHVAAALVLTPTVRADAAESTPPRSPVKAEDSPSRTERKDTESIRIYADGHVLNLFSDIEKAIGQMCEQPC